MENRIAFVLLAGGKSRRMGVAKGLLKYKQTFWILEQLNRISLSSISTIYIGLGHDHEHYFMAIPWLKKAVQEDMLYEGLQVRVIINSQPELGTFSTLQAVLNQLPSKTDILINPIDVPICDANSLESIAAAQNLAILPSFNNKHGHPIKVNESFWLQLKKLDLGSIHARLDHQIKALDNDSITNLPVSNSDILLNLNTPGIWKKYIGK